MNEIKVLKRGILALEDGTYLEGTAFGAEGEAYGEIVFNTSITGYQEILTDPSYKGQIVTLTYPQIGNYGVNEVDVESNSPKVEGLIIKSLSPRVSNYRASDSLDNYLQIHNIIGLSNVETRSLVLHIREKGAMKAVLSTIDLEPKSLIEKAKNSPGLIGRDLVKEVTTDKPYIKDAKNGEKFYVIAFDYGIKRNIINCLNEVGCKVKVVPASTSAEEVLAENPDGIFLSNGPGDPEGVPYVVETVKKLIGKKPIFGICLGQQILGLALGGKTFKLLYGHRGANHPVKDLLTNKVEITSQNHGFCVDLNSLNQDEIELTHINLNDNTLEGFRHKELPLFCVQYHPEASPGPHDSRYLFPRFTELMEKYE